MFPCRSQHHHCRKSGTSYEPDNRTCFLVVSLFIIAFDIESSQSLRNFPNATNNATTNKYRMIPMRSFIIFFSNIYLCHPNLPHISMMFICVDRCTKHSFKRQGNSQNFFYRSPTMIPCFVNSAITSLTISGRTSCAAFGSGVLLVALQIICPSFLVAQTSMARISTF